MIRVSRRTPGTTPTRTSAHFGSASLAFLILGGPAFAVLAYWALLYLQRAWSIVSFPYGWDYGETPELARAIAVAHLQPIYPYWGETPPYQMANYTPLFAVANGFLVHFWGVQYGTGRALAWGCGLLFCAGLAWLAWREGKTFLAPLVAVLFWFSSLYVWDWTPLGREDTLAMLFELLGLIVFFEGLSRGLTSWRVLGVSLVLFLAAIYTRQTAIEGLVAVGLTLLVRRPRQGLTYLMIFGLSGAAIFGLLDLLTHGAFYLNIVTGNVNVFSWNHLLTRALRFWRLYQAAIILGLGYVVSQIVRRRSPLFVFWVLAAFAVAITGGKDGAAENYELIPWATVSLTAALAVAALVHLTTALWNRPAVPVRILGVALPLVTGLLLLLHAQLSFRVLYDGPRNRQTFDEVTATGASHLLRQATESGWYRRLLPWAPTPRQLENEALVMYSGAAGYDQLTEQQEIDAIVKAQSGDVLDEDMTHLLLAGKRIYIQPFEFAEEARLGQWDDRPFVQAVQARHFDLVILTDELRPSWRTQRFTPKVVAALAANYCEEGQSGRYWIYHPCP